MLVLRLVCHAVLSLPVLCCLLQAGYVHFLSVTLSRRIRVVTDLLIRDAETIVLGPGTAVSVGWRGNLLFHP